MNFQKTLANMLIARREDKNVFQPASIDKADKVFDYLNQWELGTFHHKEKQPRTRMQIYTMWELMQKDPQIAEALSLHVTASVMKAQVKLFLLAPTLAYEEKDKEQKSYGKK